MSKHTSTRDPSMNDRAPSSRGATRRDLLRTSAGAAGLLALGRFGGRWMKEAKAAPTREPFLVVLNQYGGNDGLNMVIPVTLSSYYERRPNIAIASEDALDLDVGPGANSTYRLHPALANIHQLFTQGQVALVNQVGYPKANLSHFTSEDIYSYGVRGSFAGLGVAQSGWLARFTDRYAPTAMGAVSVGVGRKRDFQGGQTSSFLVDRLSGFQYQPDYSYRNDHLKRLDTVRSLLDTKTRRALPATVANALAQGHELTDQVQAAVGAYEAFGSSADYTGGGDREHHIQRNLRDVATLVNYGFETRVFYTGHGGFDTHGTQGGATGKQADLFRRMDAGLGAFVEDMKAMGVWNQTVIVIISEFGRRNYENGSGGTDHGHGSCFLVIGGGVNGGVYGPDLTDDDLAAEYLGYQVDFRDIYREILNDHLGVGAGAIFPEPQETNVTLGIV